MHTAGWMDKANAPKNVKIWYFSIALLQDKLIKMTGSPQKILCPWKSKSGTSST
jgi:hypothetical protein